MRATLCLLLPVCVAALGAGTAMAVEVVISPPTDDVYIDSTAPNTNYNYTPENTKLIARHSYIGPSDTHSILKFDLSAVPDSATITSATLNMYCRGFCNELVFAYRMDHDDWSENTATWNSYSPYFGDKLQLDARQVTVINYDPPYWEEWDMSGMDWQNDLDDNVLTVMLTAWVESTNYYSPANMASKEYRDVSGIAYEPYLRIEYVPEPAMITMLGLAGLAMIRRRLVA